jgi:hypothetical protein
VYVLSYNEVKFNSFQTFWAKLLYSTANATIKLSLLFLYWEMMWANNPWWRRLLALQFGSVVVSYFGVVVGSLFSCRPVKVWEDPVMAECENNTE